MSKSTLILTSETETILNGESEEKYMKYAKEHNLDIGGEMHYPLIMSFLWIDHHDKHLQQWNPHHQL